jgi:hypothetical protein
MIFTGLDPAETERDARQGWTFAWLPAGKYSGWPDTRPWELEANVEAHLDDVELRLAALGPPYIRSPTAWLKEGASIAVIPTWLEAANRVRARAVLLTGPGAATPLPSVGHPGGPATAPQQKNPISQRGGEAKSQRSHQALQRQYIQQAIDAFVSAPPESTQVKFAQHLHDHLCEAEAERKGPWSQGEPSPKPPVDVRTIEGWIRRARRRR